MEIYCASSWRNEEQPAVVAALRADGHSVVYDFKNPAPGDNGFGWRQLNLGDKTEWDAELFASKVLDHPLAARGFGLDMDALEACSACVLVLPCGRSAHLELGQAVGSGKLTIVYVPKLEEPELMYRMCDYVETTMTGVRRALSKWRPRPRWQRDLARFDAPTRAHVVGGNEFAGPLPCSITESRYNDASVNAAIGEIFGVGPVPKRGPCREYHHRECKTCGGCWRHGACSCSPDITEFRPSAQFFGGRAETSTTPCPRGHTNTVLLESEIRESIETAIRCNACPANYVRVNGRWFEAPDRPEDRA